MIFVISFLLSLVNCCQKCSENLEENRLSVTEFFDFKRFDFLKHCNTLLTTSYRPELDIKSPELKPNDASYYMSLIGILRWIVELGRVDICLEVLMMSSRMALPREEHLRELFHIFAYLNK